MNKKGISLIVLIVTIIVMVILAGVVIVNITENNPMQDAKVTKFKTNYVNMKEELEKNILKEEILKEEINLVSYGELKKYMPSMTKEFAKKVVVKEGKLLLNTKNLSGRELDMAKDFTFEVDKESNANAPYIPLGFKHIAGDVNSGFVIQEIDRKDEFVWIPVENIINFERIIYDNANNYASLNDVGEGYSKIYDSVKKYGGFYIARYETGVDRGELAVRKGLNVYNENVEKFKEKALDIYHRSDVQTDMLYGPCYDAVVKFVGTDAPNGNYTGVIAKTGQYPLKNIYDLAGNAGEVTLEYADNPAKQIVRGGSYKTQKSIASRDTNYSPEELGLRVMLYIK